MASNSRISSSVKDAEMLPRVWLGSVEIPTARR